MSLAHVTLDDLGEHHLTELVERRVRELGRMEYKRKLPSGKEDKREEFEGFRSVLHLLHLPGIHPPWFYHLWI